MLSSEEQVFCNDDSSQGTQLQNVVDALSEQPSFVKDELLSPINAQIFDFCDPELFSNETVISSEAASCSNCCYDENTPNSGSLSFPADVNSSNDSTANPSPTIAAAMAAANNANNLSMMYDHQDRQLTNDISASLDISQFSQFQLPADLKPPSQQDQFNISLIPQISSNDVCVDKMPSYAPQSVLFPPPMAPVLEIEDDCLSSVPSLLGMNQTFLDPPMAPYLSNNLSSALSENSGMFSGGNLVIGSDFQSQELDYQGDNGGGMYCSGTFPGVFNPGQMALCAENAEQFMRNGGNTSSLGSEISSLEESSYRVGKLSVEQRKEKIHRYMKKRNERNFSKKIKYACRKTLADSRPRVRGRFAKNEEFGENNRASYSNSNHEDDDDEEVNVKVEDDILNASDIFAHISDVNSFKCNYSIQSWT